MQAPKKGTRKNCVMVCSSSNSRGTINPGIRIAFPSISRIIRVEGSACWQGFGSGGKSAGENQKKPCIIVLRILGVF